MMVSQGPVKPLAVKEAIELAAHYNVPLSIINLYFCKFNDTLYPKLAWLLDNAQKKGIDHFELDVTYNSANGEWTTKGKLFRPVDKETLKLILSFDKSLHREMWEYYTKPIEEEGRASKLTVKMQTMHPYLREMSIKRCIARLCKLHAGIGMTAAEELPEITMSKEELQDVPESMMKITETRPVIDVDDHQSSADLCACGCDRKHHFETADNRLDCAACIAKNRTHRCNLQKV